MSIFRFKQFIVSQSHAAMKVGTDSVLLGSLLEADSPQRILDIGTGTGLLALMMAQRFPSATIDAVEIDADAVKDAVFNFAQSPWSDRLVLYHQPFQDRVPQSELYDLIVSNPPYYEVENQYKILANQRAQARHTQDLSFETLLEGIKTLLSENGCCWMVLPKQESEILIEKAQQKGLYLNKLVSIFPKQSKPCNRVVFMLSKKQQPVHTSDLYIYEETGEYTNEYFRYTEPFLLWNKSI